MWHFRLTCFYVVGILHNLVFGQGTLDFVNLMHQLELWTTYEIQNEHNVKMNSHPQLDQQEVCEIGIEGLKEGSSLVLNNERPLKHILAPYKISFKVCVL